MTVHPAIKCAPAGLEPDPAHGMLANNRGGLSCQQPGRGKHESRKKRPRTHVRRTRRLLPVSASGEQGAAGTAASAWQAKSTLLPVACLSTLKAASWKHEPQNPTRLSSACDNCEPVCGATHAFPLPFQKIGRCRMATPMKPDSKATPTKTVPPDCVKHVLKQEPQRLSGPDSVTRCGCQKNNKEKTFYPKLRDGCRGCCGMAAEAWHGPSLVSAHDDYSNSVNLLMSLSLNSLASW